MEFLIQLVNGLGGDVILVWVYDFPSPKDLKSAGMSDQNVCCLSEDMVILVEYVVIFEIFHLLAVIVLCHTYIVDSYYATFTNELEGFLIVIIIVFLVRVNEYKVIRFGFTSLKEFICKEDKTMRSCRCI